MSRLSRDDIRISIKLLNSQTILAQATVVLLGFWEEHGWKVLKSNEAHKKFGDCLWIQAPSYQIKNKEGKREWKEIVYVNDRRTYELVEEMIYDAYCLARSKKEGLEAVDNKESSKEKESLEVKNENVNPNDIPF